MDEKERLIAGKVGGVRPKTPFAKVTAVVVATFFIILAASHSRISWYFPHGHRCQHEEARQGTLSYAGEHIKWDACGELAGRQLECSSIDVPMDQFDAKNSGDKTFNIPLIRMRGENATQNLLLNPGGPGGSGSEFLWRRGEQLSTIVGDRFHLLSFDPRGVNQSRPLATCYPDKETQRELSRVRDTKMIEDSSDMYAWSHNYVRACTDTMGEHGKYINTPQTAADMNSILAAVGQEDMVYWGFSYGTTLGQTYAGLFPERSKRVIIDGVSNQFDWYGGLIDTETLIDTDKVFFGFFDECIKAGKNCSLSSWADTPEKLQDIVLSLGQKLKEQPLSVYVNNTVYGLLDYPKLWYNGIFPTLYKPERWYTLAKNLEQLLLGNATSAFMDYARDPAWATLGEANYVVHMSDSLSGPEHWSQDRKDLLEKMLAFANSSMFVGAEGSFYYAKQQWTIPRTHPFVPRMGVKTAHPLLILSTTYDPVCPLVSARSANAAFNGSQIVEVKGYGHCSVAVTSMCVAKHVRNFLYEGKVPENYTQCEVDSPYFIVPEEDGKLVPHKHFEDPEEQRIHLAQIQLARDLEWSHPWLKVP